MKTKQTKKKWVNLLLEQRYIDMMPKQKSVFVQHLILDDYNSRLRKTKSTKSCDEITPQTTDKDIFEEQKSSLLIDTIVTMVPIDDTTPVVDTKDDVTDILKEWVQE